MRYQHLDLYGRSQAEPVQAWVSPQRSTEAHPEHRVDEHPTSVPSPSAPFLSIPFNPKSIVNCIWRRTCVLHSTAGISSFTSWANEKNDRHYGECSHLWASLPSCTLSLLCDFLHLYWVFHYHMGPFPLRKAPRSGCSGVVFASSVGESSVLNIRLLI